ncbi:hypothetical protein [uncultured Mucilaginibacter sp.]|uniref:hypothetical protein n=1 Tax=uncultured Mucilaginibacter sp. TaxID=797541 RepID=UPI0025F71BB6|nr:hypothetical protein [uncultured Mucilaginibacter sp.]
MKKIVVGILAAIVIAACHHQGDNDGIYTSHIEGEYAVADDTLIVEGNFVTRRTGYQKLRNGKLLSKAWKTRTWPLGNENTPVIKFKGGKLIIGQTIYRKQL